MRWRSSHKESNIIKSREILALLDGIPENEWPKNECYFYFSFACNSLGKPQKVIEKFKSSLGQNPIAGKLEALASSYRQINNPQKVLQLLELLPFSKWTFPLADCAVNAFNLLEKPGETISLSSLIPESNQSRYFKISVASAYNKVGKWKEAAKLLAPLLNNLKDEKNLEYLLKTAMKTYSHLKEYQAEIPRLFNLLPSDQRSDHIFLFVATHFNNCGEYQKTIELLAPSIKKTPFLGLHLRLAEAYLEEGEAEKALQMSKSFPSNGEKDAVHALMANIHYNLQQYPTALLHAELALKLNSTPENFVLSKKGEILRHLSRWGEAERFVSEQIEKLESTSFSFDRKATTKIKLYNSLGFILKDQPQPDYEAAIDCFLKAAQLPSCDFSPNRTFTGLVFTLNKLAISNKERFAQLLKNNPSLPELLKRLHDAAISKSKELPSRGKQDIENARACFSSLKELLPSCG